MKVIWHYVTITALVQWKRDVMTESNLFHEIQSRDLQQPGRVVTGSIETIRTNCFFLCSQIITSSGCSFKKLYCQSYVRRRPSLPTPPARSGLSLTVAITIPL